MSLKNKVWWRAWVIISLGWLGVFEGRVLGQEPMVIDINEGVSAPVPFSLLNFLGDYSLASSVQKVVQKDLVQSHYFQETPVEDHLQDHQEAFGSFHYQSWKILKTNFALGARVYEQGGRLRAQVRIFDILTQKLIEKHLDAPLGDTRTLGHKISDAFYSHVTGDPGFFNTKIFYIAEKGKATSKEKRLAVMDYDGARHAYLSSKNDPSIMPAVSRDGSQVAYLSHYDKPTKVRVVSLNNRASFPLKLGRVSMPSSATFFQDGSRMLLSVMTRGGNAAIYQYDLVRHHMAPLTTVFNHSSIDVSPSLSPDGKEFMFISDRSGSPQIYRKKLRGGDPVRVSQGGGRYYSVRWSPDGQWLAFIKRLKGGYYLGVMKQDGSQERLIAQDHVIDYPSWAPNSRMIAFGGQQRNFGPFSLYIVDIGANVLRKLPIPAEGDQPVWAAAWDH